MIGNTILFKQYYKDNYGFNDWAKAPKEVEGIVVDAYTKISGDVKGDTAFGFGDVSGNIGSNRMYKVEYEQFKGGNKYYDDISHSHLVRIVKFADRPQVIDEKMRAA